MLLSNWSLVLFSCQSFMNVLIRDFDILNVDRYELEKQGF